MMNTQTSSIMSSTLIDPTNASRATPSIPVSDAVLYIGSFMFTTIPSLRVWEALTNTSTWPSWNSFIPRVTIRSQPDSTGDEPLSPTFQRRTAFTFHLPVGPTVVGNSAIEPYQESGTIVFYSGTPTQSCDPPPRW
ncbi:hypothetical protein BDW59DRAFT_135521 [Aspergillus cavernicola]|uniref:Uncharacterized protein n=1 Tax=Aspergillus cavernicola TaxID=176166 RepID=A0ABR4HN37_9EURO